MSTRKEERTRSTRDGGDRRGGDDRRGGTGGSRPKSSPPARGGYGGERRGSGGRSPQGSVYSEGSRGSYTERRQAPPRSPDSQGSYTERRSNGSGRRPKSADGSYRGSYGGGYYDAGSPRSPGGMTDPLHELPRDRNQYSMNSPPHLGGRLPTGRMLSGFAPDGMIHHPRSGCSRTQFGGMWEDHKTAGERPIQSNTRTGFSEFGDDEPTENSTYKHHFGTFFDGGDTMSHVKPNMVGTATNVRAVNGYGRNVNGGYFMREKLGDLKKYKHADSFRGIPAWARKQPEPTRPGPGYTRTDQGGYFRT